ncbi:MAG TPA: alkaline phosphatase family protein, partial [Candidatus Binataceae bacterium]|nr:alkaline phosphatase family protein [Candidatus Binataceae bacterium]
IFETEKYLNPGVETLYEAFKRVSGPGSITASIHEPQGRGADHAVFERRIVGDKARLKTLTQEMISDISPRWKADEKLAVEREEIVDVRGMAQALNLFERATDADPVFVAHEFVLTDGAGHDYGPHHDALREALYRTDKRIGAVIELLKRRGLFDSTLFILTSDHGMAAQKIDLKANPAREPLNVGIQGIFAEPMIYLRDLRVEIERTRDLRNLRVTVLDNDHLPEGDHPPIAGARVMVEGPGGKIVAEAKTPESGMVAIPTPADLIDEELTLRIEHLGFNRRTIRADGVPIGPDLRAILYGINGAK